MGNSQPPARVTNEPLIPTPPLHSDQPIVPSHGGDVLDRSDFAFFETLSVSAVSEILVQLPAPQLMVKAIQRHESDSTVPATGIPPSRAGSVASLSSETFHAIAMSVLGPSDSMRSGSVKPFFHANSSLGSVPADQIAEETPKEGEESNSLVDGTVDRIYWKEYFTAFMTLRERMQDEQFDVLFKLWHPATRGYAMSHLADLEAVALEKTAMAAGKHDGENYKQKLEEVKDTTTHDDSEPAAQSLSEDLTGDPPILQDECVPTRQPADDYTDDVASTVSEDEILFPSPRPQTDNPPTPTPTPPRLLNQKWDPHVCSPIFFGYSLQSHAEANSDRINSKLEKEERERRAMENAKANRLLSIDTLERQMHQHQAIRLQRIEKLRATYETIRNQRQSAFINISQNLPPDAREAQRAQYERDEEMSRRSFESEIGEMQRSHETRTRSELLAVRLKREELTALKDAEEHQNPIADRLEQLARLEVSRCVANLGVATESLMKSVSEITDLKAELERVTSESLEGQSDHAAAAARKTKAQHELRSMINVCETRLRESVKNVQCESQAVGDAESLLRKAIEIQRQETALLPLFQRTPGFISQKPISCYRQMLLVSIAMLTRGSFDEKVDALIAIISGGSGTSPTLFTLPFVTLFASVCLAVLRQLGLISPVLSWETVENTIRRTFSSFFVNVESETLSEYELKQLIVYLVAPHKPVLRAFGLFTAPSYGSHSSGTWRQPFSSALSVFQYSSMSSIAMYARGLSSTPMAMTALHWEALQWRPALEPFRRRAIHDRALAMGQNDPLRMDYSRFLERQTAKSSYYVTPLQNGHLVSSAWIISQQREASATKIQAFVRSFQARRRAERSATINALWEAKQVAITRLKTAVLREFQRREATKGLVKMRWDGEVRLKQAKLRAAGQVASRQETVLLMMEEAMTEGRKEVESRFRNLEHEFHVISDEIPQPVMPPLDPLDTKEAFGLFDAPDTMDESGMGEENVEENSPEEEKAEVSVEAAAAAEKVAAEVASAVDKEVSAELAASRQDSLVRYARGDHASSRRKRGDTLFEISLRRAFGESEPNETVYLVRRFLAANSTIFTRFKATELLAEFPAKRLLLKYISNHTDGELLSDLTSQFKFRPKAAKEALRILRQWEASDVESGLLWQLVRRLHFTHDEFLCRALLRAQRPAQEAFESFVSMRLSADPLIGSGAEDDDPEAIVAREEIQRLEKQYETMSQLYKTAWQRHMANLTQAKDVALALHTVESSLQAAHHHPAIEMHYRRPMTTELSRIAKHDWAARLATILPQMLTATQESAQALVSLVDDFVEIAIPTAQLLITELFSPDHDRCLPVRHARPVNGRSGKITGRGLRDGEKLWFYAHGLWLRVSLDYDGAFNGSDEAAAKVDGKERLAATNILSARVSGITTSLTATVDYCGFRVLVTSSLPLEHIVYGDDGLVAQKTVQMVHGVVRRGEEFVSRLAPRVNTMIASKDTNGEPVKSSLNSRQKTLATLGSRLGLVEHSVKGRFDLNSGRTFAASMRVYLGADDTLYCRHLYAVIPRVSATVMEKYGAMQPCSRKQNFLWHWLRPELTTPASGMAISGLQLSPDAQTPLTLKTDDESVHQETLDQATLTVLENIIPSWLSRALDALRDAPLEEAQERLAFPESLHRVGISCHLLGYMRSLLWRPLIAPATGTTSLPTDWGQVLSPASSGNPYMTNTSHISVESSNGTTGTHVHHYESAVNTDDNISEEICPGDRIFVLNFIPTSTATGTASVSVADVHSAYYTVTPTTPTPPTSQLPSVYAEYKRRKRVPDFIGPSAIPLDRPYEGDTIRHARIAVGRLAGPYEDCSVLSGLLLAEMVARTAKQIIRLQARQYATATQNSSQSFFRSLTVDTLNRLTGAGEDSTTWYQRILAPSLVERFGPRSLLPKERLLLPLLIRPFMRFAIDRLLAMLGVRIRTDTLTRINDLLPAAAAAQIAAAARDAANSTTLGGMEDNSAVQAVAGVTGFRGRVAISISGVDGFIFSTEDILEAAPRIRHCFPIYPFARAILAAQDAESLLASSYTGVVNKEQPAIFLCFSERRGAKVAFNIGTLGAAAHGQISGAVAIELPGPVVGDRFVRAFRFGMAALVNFEANKPNWKVAEDTPRRLSQALGVEGENSSMADSLPPLSSRTENVANPSHFGYVDIPWSEDLLPSSIRSPMSLAAFFRCVGSRDVARVIVATSRLSLTINRENFASVLLTQEGHVLAVPVGPVVENAWYHFAATYDGSILRSYRDGSLVSTVETAPFFAIRRRRAAMKAAAELASIRADAAAEEAKLAQTTLSEAATYFSTRAGIAEIKRTCQLILDTETFEPDEASTVNGSPPNVDEDDEPREMTARDKKLLATRRAKERFIADLLARNKAALNERLNRQLAHVTARQERILRENREPSRLGVRIGASLPDAKNRVGSAGFSGDITGVALFHTALSPDRIRLHVVASVRDIQQDASRLFANATSLFYHALRTTSLSLEPLSGYLSVYATSLCHWCRVSPMERNPRTMITAKTELMELCDRLRSLRCLEPIAALLKVLPADPDFAEVFTAAVLTIKTVDRRFFLRSAAIERHTLAMLPFQFALISASASSAAHEAAAFIFQEVIRDFQLRSVYGDTDLRFVPELSSPRLVVALVRAAVEDRSLRVIHLADLLSLRTIPQREDLGALLPQTFALRLSGRVGDNNVDDMPEHANEGAILNGASPQELETAVEALLCDDDVAILAENLPLVEAVDLRRCVSLTDRTLDSLTKFNSLSAVVLDGCHRITDAGISRLAVSLPRLAVLSLQGLRNLSDVALNSLVSLHTLRTLHIGRCPQLSIDALIPVVKANRQLSSLGLSGLQADDSAMVALAAAISSLSIEITSLDLSLCPQLTDSAIIAITEATRDTLRLLNLRGLSRLSDASIRIVCCQCWDLEQLNLSDCFLLTDAAFQYDPQADGRAPAARTMLTALKTLVLDGCDGLTDSFSSILVDRCRRLETLVLRSVSQLTDATPFALTNPYASPASTTAAAATLRHIDLSFLSALSSASIVSLCSAAPSLERLELSGCSAAVDDQLIDSITQACPGIQTLALNHCILLTDSALCFLAERLWLEHLELASCNRITDAGIQVVATACQGLRFLSLLRLPRLSLSALEFVQRTCPDAFIRHSIGC